MAMVRRISGGLSGPAAWHRKRPSRRCSPQQIPRLAVPHIRQNHLHPRWLDSSRQVVISPAGSVRRPRQLLIYKDEQRARMLRVAGKVAAQTISRDCSEQAGRHVLPVEHSSRLLETSREACFTGKQSRRLLYGWTTGSVGTMAVQLELLSSSEKPPHPSRNRLKGISK